jgi:PAS domain S-box-containing protein
MWLRDLGLKWKLIWAFLFLSFAGTTVLVWIAFRSQEALIHLSERRALESNYQRLLQNLQDKRDSALSLAWTVAQDPHVKQFLAAGDRRALLEHLRPTYQRLHGDFGVGQIHFHVPPATSFLRIHRPDQHGDEMAAFRATILHVIRTGEPAGGLEWGRTGYGIRGVVPVLLHGKLTGTVEVGFSLGEAFVRSFRAQTGCHITLYVKDVEGGEEPLALTTTLERAPALASARFDAFRESPAPELRMPMPTERGVSGLLGPVHDFSGRLVAVSELRVDRRPFLAIMDGFRMEMAAVEAVGLLLAALVVWGLVTRFLAPIREMVQGAAEIVAGERLHMPVRGRDEMSRLARALNSMVGYLEASRQRAKDYAQNLEQEVQRRTRELRLSEERYRTLVDQVPLVVFQMTPDRRLRFINSHVWEMLGVEPSELLNVPEALDRFVHAEDRERVREGFRVAVAAGSDWVGEYRMETPQGRLLHVREHAVSAKDEDGRVIRVDGILVDLTDQRRLQEKTVQAEELRTLGEISARLAHEIRNPLTSIGGLSRRTLRDLPEDHRARRWVQGIVTEVERLETILQMILSYIQPGEVQLEPGDLRPLLAGLMEELAPEFLARGRRLNWETPPCLPTLLLDRDQLRRALESVLRHALFSMEENGVLDVAVAPGQEGVHIRCSYASPLLSQDDLDHYFYPFLAQGTPDPALLRLPMARLIVYRHGGVMQVSRAEGQEIVLTVTLPALQGSTDLREPEIR